MSGGKGDDSGLADKGKDSSLEGQRAMVRRAAEGGMSNLVVLALGLDRSADVTKVAAGSGPGDVPLVTACLHGHIAVVKNLLDLCHTPLDSHADVTVDDEDCTGVTPLWAAAVNGHLELVKYLVQKGASVNLTTHSLSSPLRAASFQGHLPVVEFLVENGADVNSTKGEGDSVLSVACYNGHKDIVHVLLEQGADVNLADGCGESVLIIACDRGHKDIVIVLLDNRADVNFTDGNGSSVLMIACDRGHTDIVRILLERGADVNATDSDGESVLMMACRRGHKAIVIVFLDNRADVNFTDGDDISALMIACDKGHTDIVHILLERGADVNATDSDGESVLMMACREGHIDIVHVLLKHSAGVDSISNDGYSVLMIACLHDHKDIVQVLLYHRADVDYTTPDADERDISGSTALHYAAEGGHVDICKLLLARGASIYQNSRGDTPLMAAAIFNHDQLVTYLADCWHSSRDEKANALEVLGTQLWRDDQVDGCLELWQRAMEVRHRPGKPVAWKREAEKLAVYGHATEVQTLEELRRLQRSRGKYELGVQCMLIRERLLGKEHAHTCDIIRYNSAAYAENNRCERAMELMLHVLDNLSALCPFTSHPLPNEYASLVHLLVKIKPMEGEPMEGESRVTFGQVLTALKRATSDFARGEATRQQNRSERCQTGRHNHLKMILHVCCLLHKAVGRATSRERDEFSAVVTDLVQKVAPRGKGGDTLLHMACHKDTEVFDTREDHLEGCSFPAAEVVQVLLDAGADPTAQNEAGQTALQTIREQQGDHSQVVNLLSSHLS